MFAKTLLLALWTVTVTAFAPVSIGTSSRRSTGPLYSADERTYIMVRGTSFLTCCL